MQPFPLYILPPFNVYRYAIDCASRVLQLYASRPVIYSANESLNAISSAASLLLFTFFAYGSNYFIDIPLQGDGRDIVSLIGTCRNFCVLCQRMSYRYHNQRLQCSTLLYYPFIRTALLVNGVNFSYNLEYSAKLLVTQVVRFKIAH